MTAPIPSHASLPLEQLEVTVAPSVTPLEHFERCGPFCEHVEFCAECSNEYGLCIAHKRDNLRGIAWRRP